MPRCLAMAALFSVLVVVLPFAGCGGNSGTDAPPSTSTASPTPTATPSPTATATASPTPTATVTPIPFCDLPGSVQTTANGLVVVPGGPAGAPDLSFLHLPVGFCAHFFAKVGNTRQLRFAPSGELFVASPTRATTGNGQG